MTDSGHRHSMEALPFRLGGFGTLVVDFPWPFEDQANRMRLPYPAMTEREILDLPLAALAADRSHLYLWRVAAHAELAHEVIRRAGFAHKSELIWVKTTLDGNGLRIGGGHYLRNAHELCLFAVRGRLTGLVHDIASVVFAPRTEHSRKPEEVQDRAERLSPGPRVELFATRNRPGWVCWGPKTHRSEPISSGTGTL